VAQRSGRAGRPRDARQTRQDPRGPADGLGRVLRGGSCLCHASYCNRYRVAARTMSTPESTTGNIGIRCAAGPGPAGAGFGG
jgi:formylglycine-generating enzyme required for sulfatase activity